MDLGVASEDVAKALAGHLHLTSRPCCVFGGHVVLPFHVIERMNAGLEPLVAHLSHHGGAAATDIGTGQDSAIQKRSDTVVRNHRSAPDLAHESASEYALDGAAGVVGPQAEQECCAGIVLLQQFNQPWHPIARPAVGVYVDL